MFEEGRGTEPSLERAEELYAEAADLGLDDAVAALRRLDGHERP